MRRKLGAEILSNYIVIVDFAYYKTLARKYKEIFSYDEHLNVVVQIKRDSFFLYVLIYTFKAVFRFVSDNESLKHHFIFVIHQMLRCTKTK